MSVVTWDERHSILARNGGALQNRHGGDAGAGASAVQLLEKGQEYGAVYASSLACNERLCFFFLFFERTLIHFIRIPKSWNEQMINWTNN